MTNNEKESLFVNSNTYFELIVNYPVVRIFYTNQGISIITYGEEKDYDGNYSNPLALFYVTIKREDDCCEIITYKDGVYFSQEYIYGLQKKKSLFK